MNTAKYLISRVLIVFLFKFFSNWAFNIKSQLLQFFNLSDGFGLTALSYILPILVFALGVFVINLLISFFNLKDGVSSSELVRKIRDKGAINSLKFFISNFFELLKTNFNKEVKSEKYPNLFVVFVFIFLSYSKGNPILNNYYGIYKEYEIGEQGKYGELSEYVEKQNYIVSKSNANEIRDRINNLEESYKESEPYFEVEKRGYLFIQAGLFDGYRTYYKDDEGFIYYIECMFFSLLEKFINTFIYFFIPFITCIAIYHYKFEDKKDMNR